MLFFTWPFAAFFAIFYPIYLLSRRTVLSRNLVFIIASYFFYGWWNVHFLALLAFTTGLDYLTALGAAGRRLDSQQLAKSCGFLLLISGIGFALNGLRQAELLLLPPFAACALFALATWILNRIEDRQRRAKTWLLLSIVVNLAVLAFFKYVNFFGESLDEAFSALGVHLGFVALNIVLPLGISFHTFQSIGRTVDTYRGKLEPSTGFIEFAAFLSYFPQILAGPIERAGHMLPQFRTIPPITWALIRSGAMLFLWGLAKKIVVADNLAAMANPIFAHPERFSSGELTVALLAFTFQIYCDFSGYTDMARGLAKIMGFDLRLNFNLPYFARTPSEFWRRWHISLSEWLRDYLYISLGGNRGTQFMMYRNLMLTMLLGGLWHGAAWTFVMWGFLHGAVQVIYRMLNIDDRLKRVDDGSAKGVIANLAAWAVFMPIVCVTWAYFRAETMAQANMMLARIARFDGMTSGAWSTLAFYVVPLFLIECGLRFAPLRIRYERSPFLLRYTAVIGLLYSVMVLTSSQGQAFIYFDF
ncbi:MBOAT family O-acyltransferase [Flavisphingomonas formosensis]|uniref:MBOAT family O-acyltransferase n=1 Tax=Flavisphingomonas formosensis TaxID=861534 RepID=UPI0012F8B4E7|nr:MBOAT family O-acyltransferase [Sphingomonas formosensis]